MLKYFNVQLDPQVVAGLKRIALVNERSFSATLRIVLREYVAAHGGIPKETTSNPVELKEWEDV